MSAKKMAAILSVGVAISTIAPAVAGEATGRSDKAPKVEIFGRVMYDYAYADGKNTPFSVSEPELRNARIGSKITLPNRGKLKVELHTDDSGDVILTDAYAEMNTGFDIAKLRIGQFKTPNSLDEQTSSRFISVHERAAFSDAFELNRRVGVALTGKTDQHTYMLGVFGQNIDDDATFGGYAVAGRATYSPNLGIDDLKLHTGASFRFRDTDADQSDLRYRQRPVTHIPGRIISTGRIADSDLFAGVEAALVKGPFWTAGEFAVTFADCSSCSEDPSFSGGYIEAGFILNGEKTLKGGKFDRPKLDEGRFGAASFVMRYDTLDLNGTAVEGGSYQAFILGADWQPKKYLRLGVNGFIANADLGDVTSGLGQEFADAVTTGLAEETVKGVTLRAQFDFRSN